MHLKKSILPLLFFYSISFGFCEVLYSQTEVTLVENQYKVELIYANDLQNPGDFEKMTIDSLGFLWLANNSFLGCFDGNKMITYSNGSEQYPISSADIDLGFYDVREIHNGNLLLSQWAGRSCYTFNPYQRMKTDRIVPDTINPGGIFGFADDGTIYFASLKQDSVVLKKYINNEEDSVIYRVAGKFDHYDLLHTNLYNWLFLGNSLKGFPTHATGKIIEQQLDFKYLIGSNKDRLHIYDASKNRILHWDEKEKKLKVYYQLPDAIKRNVEKFLVVGKHIFIGNSRSYFLINSEENTFQNFTEQLKTVIEELTPVKYGNSLQDIYYQDSSSMYFLTNKSLLKLSKSSINDNRYLERHDQTELLSHRKIVEDADQNIYVSYYLGILRKTSEDNSFHSYLDSEDIDATSKSTYDLKYWNDHLIWNNALINVKTDSVSFLGEPSYSGHCNTLLEGDSLWIFKWWSKGDFWMHDLKTKLYNQTKLKYPNEAGDSARVEMVNAMVFDKDKTIWLTSRWQGLFQYSKKGRLLRHYDFEALGIFRIETGPTSLIHHDSLVWIGHHNGLLKLNIKDNKKKYFKFPDIDKDRSIFSIEELDDGILLCGSNKGLIRFDTKTEQYAYLSSESPLGKSQFNRNSTFQASNGKVYFGSTSGLYSFFPKELDWQYPGEDIAPIHLDRISYYDNREQGYVHNSTNINNIESIDLEYDHTNLNISASVVSMDNPVFYSYRLEGFADEWTPYSAEPEINLFSLPAGRHNLQIRASYDKSTTNYTSRDIELNVAQIWYKRPWVIALISLGVASFIFGMIRLRYLAKAKRIKEKEMLRVKISSDLHDDVGSILSVIAMQSEMMSMEISEKKEDLRDLSAKSRDAMDRMRDTVWAIDSRKDFVANLIYRMKDYVQRIDNISNVSVHFEYDEDSLDHNINPDVRQNLYLIFKEALNNALKYSDGETIRVIFGNKDFQYYMKIHDNGRQTEMNNTDGLGMRNMKMRAENIGGVFKNGYKEGFYIEISVPK